MNNYRIVTLALSSVGSLMILSHLPSSASSFEPPNSSSSFMMEEAAVNYPEQETSEYGYSGIEQVRRSHETRLLAIEGVVGVGIGQNAIGNDTVVVYTMNQSVRQRIPSEIEGFTVTIEVTGPIDAL